MFACLRFVSLSVACEWAFTCEWVFTCGLVFTCEWTFTCELVFTLKCFFFLFLKSWNYPNTLNLHYYWLLTPYEELLIIFENPFFWESFWIFCVNLFVSLLIVKIFLNPSCLWKSFLIYAHLWESFLLSMFWHQFWNTLFREQFWSVFMFWKAFFEGAIILIFWFMASD